MEVWRSAIERKRREGEGEEKKNSEREGEREVAKSED